MKKDDACNPSGDVNVGIYDGFSETQTESQVSALTVKLFSLLMLPFKF